MYNSALTRTAQCVVVKIQKEILNKEFSNIVGCVFETLDVLSSSSLVEHGQRTRGINAGLQSPITSWDKWSDILKVVLLIQKAFCGPVKKPNRIMRVRVQCIIHRKRNDFHAWFEMGSLCPYRRKKTKFNFTFRCDEVSVYAVS